ncbi:MAG: hypothetical protein ACREC9_12335 [Methylocella sp.]
MTPRKRERRRDAVQDLMERLDAMIMVPAQARIAGANTSAARAARSKIRSLDPGAPARIGIMIAAASHGHWHASDRNGCLARMLHAPRGSPQAVTSSYDAEIFPRMAAGRFGCHGRGE